MNAYDIRVPSNCNPVTIRSIVIMVLNTFLLVMSNHFLSLVMSCIKPIVNKHTPIIKANSNGKSNK